MNQQPILYSRGRDKYDNAPAQRQAESFDAFEQTVLADRSACKGQTYICAPLASGKHYQKPGQYAGLKHWRLKDHALSREFVALDMDGFSSPAAFEETKRYLERYRGFGYTTASHTDALPRARAVLAVSHPITREQGIAMGQAIQAEILAHVGPGAVAFDESVYRGEQPIYTPLTTSEEFHFHGAVIDVDGYLAKQLPAQPKSPSPLQTPNILGGFQWRDTIKDGEGREDYLLRAAGHLRGKGLEQNAIDRFLLDFNQLHIDTTLDSDVVLDRARRYENCSPSCSALGPLFSPDTYSAGRYLAAEPPPIRWLLVDALPAGIVGTVVAPGGTGKSWWLMQLGVSIATGIPLAGVWEVGETGGVLMLLAEDDDIQIQRRLHHLTAALPATRYLAARDQLHQNLIVVPRVAESNLLTTAKGNSREVEATEFVDQVIATAQQVPNLKLIVIDPVSRFRGGDENSAQDTTRFVEAMERIAKSTGATVIAAHHSNKSAFNAAEPTQSASRGSSALTDGVRWQMNLTTFTVADAKNFGVSTEDKGFHLTATITKNNYAAPQPSVILKRCTGGYLDKSDLTPAAHMKIGTLGGAIIDLVKDELRAGRKYSKTAFTNQFSGERGVLHAGNNKVRDLIQELLDTRRLMLDPKKKLGLPVRIGSQAAR